MTVHGPPTSLAYHCGSPARVDQHRDGCSPTAHHDAHMTLRLPRRLPCQTPARPAFPPVPARHQRARPVAWPLSFKLAAAGLSPGRPSAVPLALVRAYQRPPAPLSAKAERRLADHDPQAEHRDSHHSLPVMTGSGQGCGLRYRVAAGRPILRRGAKWRDIRKPKLRYHKKAEAVQKHDERFTYRHFSVSPFMLVFLTDN